MPSENLLEICTLLKRMDSEKDKFMPYHRILKSARLSPNELAWLTARLEASGYLACTGHDFWGDPRGYRLLKSAGSITLFDLLHCTGMENLLFDGMDDSSGRLAAALGSLHGALRRISINDMRLQQ
jgi:DNA-binding IscR family transcriptional regulator